VFGQDDPYRVRTPHLVRRPSSLRYVGGRCIKSAVRFEHCLLVAHPSWAPQHNDAEFGLVKRAMLVRLLGRIIEAVSGERLDVYFRKHGFVVSPSQRAKQANAHRRKPDGFPKRESLEKLTTPTAFSGGGPLFDRPRLPDPHPNAAARGPIQRRPHPALGDGCTHGRKPDWPYRSRNFEDDQSRALERRRLAT
jgi:hypothetical protein